MASYSEITSKHATLTSTTADTVTITGKWPYVEIINRDATAPMYATAGPATAVTAVAAADDTIYIPPGGSKVVRSYSGVFSVVGNGNAYSVEGFDL